MQVVAQRFIERLDGVSHIGQTLATTFHVLLGVHNKNRNYLVAVFDCRQERRMIRDSEISPKPHYGALSHSPSLERSDTGEKWLVEKWLVMKRMNALVPALNILWLARAVSDVSSGWTNDATGALLLQDVR